MADGMMSNPFLGLLNQGMSPEQAQAEVDRQRALQFANLNPQQRVAAGIYEGITGIGRALGARDPMLEQASKLRELAGRFDTNTAEGMLKFANAASSINSQLAQQAAEQARKMMQQEATLAKTTAETEETKRKGTAAASAASARAAALIKRFPDMTQEEAAGLAEDPKVVADLLKVPKEQAMKTEVTSAGGRKLLINSLTGETIKDLGPASKTLEESLGAGLGEMAKIMTKGREAEVKEEGQFAAKDYNRLGQSVASGVSSSRNIEVLEKALTNAFTGKFADVKAGTISGLQGLGLPVSKELQEATSNTELIGAMGTRYVFPLVKNFPGSLAAKELERLEKTAPNTLQQPETIRSLVNLLKVDLAEQAYTYNKAKDYRKQNKDSLIGFSEADSRIEFQQKLTELRRKIRAVKQAGSISDAEKQDIEALKKELGVQ